MLSKVNEDCLLVISNYLNLPNHVSMANASSHLASIVQDVYRTRFVETSYEFWRFSEEKKIMFDKFWGLISGTLQKLRLEPKEDHHMHVIRSWRLTNLKSFEFSIWNNEVKLPLDTLKICLQHCSEHLEHLTLRDVYWKHFRVLYTLKFPNVTHLELSAKPYLFKPDEKFQAEVFPQLRSLILKCVTSCEGIWNFSNLTELTIEKSTRLIPRHLEKILLSCPLRKLSINCMLDSFHTQCYEAEQENCRKAMNQLQDTLEEIFLDYHYLGIFGSELPKLKKLRKLNFLPPSYCSCNCKSRVMPAEIAEHIAKIVKRLVLTHAELPENWFALQTFLQSLEQVESLKIIFTSCTPEHILSLAKTNARSLKEFHFHGVLDLDAPPNFARTDYSSLLNVLKYCHQIELLDLSDTYCDEKFIMDVSTTIRENFGVRQWPLVVRLNRTKCKLRNLKKLKLPKYIQFSKERPNYSWAKIGVECEL